MVNQSKVDKCLKKLPDEIRTKFWEIYNKTEENPKDRYRYCSREKGDKTVMKMKIGRRYRAMGKIVNSGVIWNWVGTHEDYNKRLK